MTFAPVMILLLVFAIAARSEDTSTRVLLRPPDNMPTTRIGGKDYLKGEVYLSKTADPALLKPRISESRVLRQCQPLQPLQSHMAAHHDSGLAAAGSCGNQLRLYSAAD